MTTDRKAHRLLHRGLELLHSRPELRARAHGRPLLVGIDETSDVRGVLRVADLLARRHHVNAHLVGVSERRGRSPAEEDVGRLEVLRERLREETRTSMHRTIGRSAYWSIDAAFGTLPEVLAFESRERQPQLVLLASGAALDSRDHENIDMPARVARAADVPVLVVPPTQERLPRRVVVATDFSRASRHAARAALALAGAGARVDLVHVEPEIRLAAKGYAHLRRANAEGVRRLLGALRRELVEPASLPAAWRPALRLRVNEGKLLRGEPASAVVDFAERRAAELIVLGLRGVAEGHSAPPDDVATQVLREARCAVLVAPPPSGVASISGAGDRGA